MNLRRQKSRGLALITAMLVVSIATIAAVAVSSRVQLDIRRTENLLRTDQAWQHALGMEAWARGLLAQDAVTGPQVDHLLEDWNVPIVATEVEGGTVNAALVDSQGRFNLNNLVDAKTKKARANDVQRFRLLLSNLGLNPELTDALVDWIDKDSQTSFPNGAEEDAYLALTPAYRCANRPLAHPSELLLVKGFTPEIYEILAPHVSALPTAGVPINVNTATLQVLRSLTVGISEQDAQDLIDTRENTPFETMNDFLTHPALAARGGDQLKYGIDLRSDYFQLRGGVEVGRARVEITSLIQRNGKKDIHVIRRMRERLFSG